MAASAAVAEREPCHIGRLERMLWSAMCTVVRDEDTSVERKFSFCGCMAIIQYHARSLKMLFGEDGIGTLPEAAQLRRLCLWLYHSHVGDARLVSFGDERQPLHRWLREQCTPLFRVALRERMATNLVETIKDWFERIYVSFVDNLLRCEELFRLTFLHYQVALRLAFGEGDSDGAGAGAGADAQYRLLKEHSPFASAKLWENWYNARAATVARLTSCTISPIKVRTATTALIDTSGDVERIEKEEEEKEEGEDRMRKRKRCF